MTANDVSYSVRKRSVTAEVLVFWANQHNTTVLFSQIFVLYVCIIAYILSSVVKRSRISCTCLIVRLSRVLSQRMEVLPGLYFTFFSSARLCRHQTESQSVWLFVMWSITSQQHQVLASWQICSHGRACSSKSPMFLVTFKLYTVKMNRIIVASIWNSDLIKYHTFAATWQSSLR